jgi:hypothetical protein
MNIRYFRYTTNVQANYVDLSSRFPLLTLLNMSFVTLSVHKLKLQLM